MLRSAVRIKTHIFIFVLGSVYFIPPCRSPLFAATPPNLKGNYDYSKGWYHRIEAGDTLDKVARKYNSAAVTLARVNNISPTEPLKIGTYLYIPPGSAASLKSSPLPPSQIKPKTAASYTPPKKTPAPAKTSPSKTYAPPSKTAKTQPVKPSSSKVIAQPAAKTAIASRAETAPPAPVPQTKSSQTASSRGYIWPVQGKVTKGFSASKEAPHKGLDISAPKGTPIRAVKEGKVIYSGNDIPGYGNLVIMEHSGGISTVYAHNSENLVKAGQWAAQGMVIARVGSTGSAASNHLHFEIRKNALTVNPLTYLP